MLSFDPAALFRSTYLRRCFRRSFDIYSHEFRNYPWILADRERMAPRFFRHGELPLVVLALLEREPMHGYQILGELERVFVDAYVPSAGSVYPAIRTLRQGGLIGATTAGRRSVYSLTDLGHRELLDRGEELAALELRAGVRVRSATSVDGAVDRFAARVRAFAPSLDPVETEAVLADAAMRLQRLAEGS